MNLKNSDIRWVVQSNITSQEDLDGIRIACTNTNTDWIEVKIIPFTSTLPEFEIRPFNVYYGSTTFNNLVYEDTRTKAGIFFNPETFSIANYIEKWGRHMLNYEASITTFQDLMNAGSESRYRVSPLAEIFQSPWPPSGGAHTVPVSIKL